MTTIMVPVHLECHHTQQRLELGGGWSWSATVVDLRSGNKEVILESHELFSSRQTALADAEAALQRRGHGS